MSFVVKKVYPTILSNLYHEERDVLQDVRHDGDRDHCAASVFRPPVQVLVVDGSGQKPERQVFESG